MPAARLLRGSRALTTVRLSLDKNEGRLPGRVGRPRRDQRERRTSPVVLVSTCENCCHPLGLQDLNVTDLGELQATVRDPGCGPSEAQGEA